MLVPGDETEAQRRRETMGRPYLQEDESETLSKLLEAVGSLNIAVRAERTLTGHVIFFVVDGYARELPISPELVRLESMERLHAVMAAFAVGAAEIKFRDGTTLGLIVEPKAVESSGEPAPVA